MYAVGIRELKAKLSDFVRKVRDGEVILVTDRGRVVAELRAATVQLPADDADDELGLRDLGQSGALERGLAHDPEAYEPSPLALAEGTSEGLLKWLRGAGSGDPVP